MAGLFLSAGEKQRPVIKKEKRRNDMGTDRGKSTFKVPADKAEHRLAVTYHQISKLKLNPNNPRAHSPRQIRQIARSIETFGFLVPVLVDGQGNVLASHGRILAALLLGWAEVPVISVTM
jgi:hypothetical protein